MLAGRDVLGLAQTGTGKTAAFGLPILSNLLAHRGAGAAPRALILAPTRELATQIDKEIAALGKFTPLRSTVVFGGVPIPRQVRALARRPDVLVACPGRLLDLYRRRDVDLSGVETVVLDEADHMFDMGFLPDIRRILGALPRRRQNLLFSATMPREIRRLTDDVLQRAHVVELATSAPAETIEHSLYPVAEDHKQDLLEHLLGEADFNSAIVFLRTRSRAKRLAERLARRGHAAVALQGNMSQSQRDRAMKGFREGRYKILVATDIAARGIDVSGISHVVNYDVPSTPDAYTHRIGRTGRAERRGKACTLVTTDDRAQVRSIEARLGAEIPRIVLEAFGGAAALEAGPRKRRWAGGGAAEAAGGERGARRSKRGPSAVHGGRRRRAWTQERSAGHGETDAARHPFSSSAKPGGTAGERFPGRRARKRILRSGGTSGGAASTGGSGGRRRRHSGNSADGRRS